MAEEMTYVALKALTIGGERREPGDLVPEAMTWNNVSAYISTGRIAAVPKSSVDPDSLRTAEQRYQQDVEAAHKRARVQQAPAGVGDEDDLEDEYTYDELYEQAQDADIEGRSDMDKSELAEALAAQGNEDEQSKNETEPVKGETSEDDPLAEYHTGQGWYEVPGSDKKMRRNEAMEFLTSPEGEEE